MKAQYPLLALLVLSALSCYSSAPAGARAFTKASQNVNSALPAPTELPAAGQSNAEEVGGRVSPPPASFRGIDFKNFSYPYRFSGGRNKAVLLRDGEYEYEFADDNRGWFTLSDLYFTDLTGDDSPEAIAALWHVSCGASCDGGAGLFYVYTIRRGKLKQLWQFETGSLGYGCGLKSLSTKDKGITIELFGRCFGEENEPPFVFKFQTKDLTRMAYRFDGEKIVEIKKEYISSPERSVQNYRPEISINE
ncbi:MAG: hypothetical protein M3362_02635 [Acidobacteriota bacterium]|nr:hypothetical protein [Acidobacteriota bacterium]